MKTTKSATVRFAICVDNSEYPASLELHRVYRVLSDKGAQQDGDLRVVDESGEDYLYPASRFILLPLPRRTAETLRKSYPRSLQQAV